MGIAVGAGRSTRRHAETLRWLGSVALGSVVLSSVAPGPAAWSSAAAAPIAHRTTLAEVEAALATGDSAGVEPGAAQAPYSWREGASLFANTTLSGNDEIIDVGRRRNYQQAGLNAGLRLPLLGARTQQALQRQRLELQRWQSDTAQALQRRELLAQARRAYVELWSATTRHELAARYLITRPTMEALLTRRQQAGLLLNSDREEFLAGFAAVEADSVRSAAELRAASTFLGQVSGLHITDVERPALPDSCLGSAATPDALQDLLAIQPEHRLLQHRLETSAARDQALGRDRLQTELRVGLSSSWETSAGAPGRTVYAAISVDYALARTNASRSAAQAEHLAALIAARELRTQLLSEFNRLANAAPALQADLQLAQRARSAAEIRVQERSLRAATLAGDVIEQLQQSRLQWYRAMVAEHSADRANLEWRIEAARYDAGHCSAQTTPPMGAPAQPTADRALYVWHSAPLLQALRDQRSSAVLEQARQLGITRLRWSLDGAQLDRYRHDDSELRRALASAHDRGLKIELLLGEPTFMQPAGRQRLLAIVADLATLPFDGLHLDLEPAQLATRGGSGLAHLPELLATLRETGSLSPWPIGVSLHPRELTVRVESQPFGQQLERLGIEPTIMIYVGDADRLTAIAHEALRDLPGLHARIALSVERELDAASRPAAVDSAGLLRHFARIESALADSAIAGLALQTSNDWPTAASPRGDDPPGDPQ